MTRTRTIDILRHLRDGVDPRDGRPLAPDHLCQNAEVVRALFEAVAALGAAAGAEASRSRRSRRAAEISAASTGGVAPDDETMEVVVRESAARPKPANAGQPWSEDDDRRLAEAFDGGANIAELMEAFGRTRSSIRARLILLGRGELLPPGPLPRYPILAPVGEEPDAAEDESREEESLGERSSPQGGPFALGDPIVL